MTRNHYRGVSLAVAIAIIGVAGCTAKHQAHSSNTQPEPRHTELPVTPGNRADEGDAILPAEHEQAVNGAMIERGQAANESMAGKVIGHRAHRLHQRRQMNTAYRGALAAPAPAFAASNRENYAHLPENTVKLTSENPVSTFSIDVDSGAYANVRRFLRSDQLPPQDAVRVEELLNYFSYDYPMPPDSTVPFSVTTELAATPWNQDTWILQIGLQGYEIPTTERPPANLVFLLDVSGSMNSANKLPLLKKSLRLLTRQLGPQDRISIVVYAGASGVVLDPTPGNDRHTINEALQRLRAGGSTNGADGIRLAYAMARNAYIDGGINRIILATDGDFNVGTVNFEALKDLAERKRATGVSLTTLGFGTGNYNDHLLEQLADAGNGNYAYIDSLQEARKVLVNEVSSTLVTIASDVKIQVEFNPHVVAEYRLIGYENRGLNREDFNNDKVDAGDIGAGHTVTALYELTPVNSRAQLTAPLRYGNDASTATDLRDEIAYLKLRYKQPGATVSNELRQPIHIADVRPVDAGSENLRLATAVAGFGQLLRGSVYTGDFTYRDVGKLANSALANDPHGYRREFLELVDLADGLQERQANTGMTDNAVAVSGNGHASAKYK